MLCFGPLPEVVSLKTEIKQDLLSKKSLLRSSKYLLLNWHPFLSTE